MDSYFSACSLDDTLAYETVLMSFGILFFLLYQKNKNTTLTLFAVFAWAQEEYIVNICVLVLLLIREFFKIIK